MTEYTRHHPFISRIQERRPLTGPNSQKLTSHLVVDLRESGIEYCAGDSFGVLPRHSEQLVERTLEALGATGDEQLLDKRRDETVSLRELLTYRRNITRLQKRVVQLVAPGAIDDVPSFVNSHELWDAISEPNIELQQLVDSLPLLLPRLFSVASSPLVHPSEVHFTIAYVQYSTRGIERRGVATDYLCKHAPLEQRCVPVYLQPAEKFRLPTESDTDIIMVGPGTGIAPFRAFLQEREATGAKGRNWLFFGDWCRATDYLYAEELEQWKQQGMLKLDLAFSRDQDYKIYVQDRMRESAAELWAWLQAGAHFYVCGDGKQMAPAVEATLMQIAQDHGSMSLEEAAAYLKQLRKDGRYLKDVY